MADFTREYAAALEAGRLADETEPRATAASYEKKDRRVTVELRNGCSFTFPVDLVQGLKGAANEDLARIELTPGGEGLYWPALDWDHGVPGLVMGIFGSEKWMAELRSELARKGGSVQSAAKAAASRANGAKGGRPKKAARPA